jgi:predicted CopG family antitoxin
MTERKNIKIDAEMYERLRDEKTQYETWNAFFDRLLGEVEDGE